MDITTYTLTPRLFLHLFLFLKSITRYSIPSLKHSTDCSHLLHKTESELQSFTGSKITAHKTIPLQAFHLPLHSLWFLAMPLALLCLHRAKWLSILRYLFLLFISVTLLQTVQTILSHSPCILHHHSHRKNRTHSKESLCVHVAQKSLRMIQLICRFYSPLNGTTHTLQLTKQPPQKIL